MSIASPRHGGRHQIGSRVSRAATNMRDARRRPRTASAGRRARGCGPDTAAADMVAVIDVGRGHVRRRTFAAPRSAATLVTAIVADRTDDGTEILGLRWRE
jgi:hypothetical protein